MTTGIILNLGQHTSWVFQKVIEYAIDYKSLQSKIEIGPKLCTSNFDVTLTVKYSKNGKLVLAYDNLSLWFHQNHESKRRNKSISFDKYYWKCKMKDTVRLKMLKLEQTKKFSNVTTKKWFAETLSHLLDESSKGKIVKDLKLLQKLLKHWMNVLNVSHPIMTQWNKSVFSLVGQI